MLKPHRSVGIALSPNDTSVRVVVSPNDKWVVAREDGVDAWQLDTGRAAESLSIRQRVGCLAFSPMKSDVLLVAEDFGTIREFNVPEGRQLRKMPLSERESGFILPECFAPDQRSVAGRYWDGFEGLNESVGVWDVRSGRLIRRFGKDGFHYIREGTLVYSPDGGILTVANFRKRGELDLWDMTTSRKQRTLKGHKDIIQAVAFSPDGKMLATGSKDRTVHLWEMFTGALRWELVGHKDEVLCLAFSPDGKTLASGSADGTILLCDVRTAPLDLRDRQSSSNRSLEQCWDDLGGGDAAKAYRAMLLLNSAGKAGVRCLAERLSPARKPGRETTTRLMKELDDMKSSIRDQAECELEKLAELVAPDLRRELEQTTSLEVRRRIERVLEKVENGQSAHQLRGLRAVEALEYMSPQARVLLEKLSTGAPEAMVTKRAKEALSRVSARTRDRPAN